MQHFELLLEILRGESQTLDFKQRISSPQKIAKSLVAFANTEGGSLLIGVKDDKTLVGVDPFEEEYQIKEAATRYCDPEVYFEPKVIPIITDTGKELTLLRIHIPLSSQRPHKALNHSGEWVTYVRNRDQSLLAGKLTEKLMSTDQFKANHTHTFAKHEKVLIEALQKSNRVELKEYMKVANISERRAKRSLQELVSKGILLKNEFNKRAFYSLSFTS